jgi:hypothetical protein
MGVGWAVGSWWIIWADKMEGGKGLTCELFNMGIGKILGGGSTFTQKVGGQ